jgi:GntR family transcriptional regulator
MLPAPLDPKAPAPLYRQLRDRLQRALRSGEWDPQRPLPSERELVERFGVSRATVRQAIGDLEREGWLVRRRGKGTFAAGAVVEQPLARLSGFSEVMREQGREPGSRLLGAVLEPPGPAVARALGLGPGGVVAVVTRLRLADAVPLMVERSHLDYALVPGLLEHAPALTGSLYALLAERYRLRLHGGEEILEAAPAPPWVAKALGLRPGAPILYTERVVTTDAGTPLEVAHRYARGDLCRFRVSLAGDNARLALKETP